MGLKKVVLFFCLLIPSIVFADAKSVLQDRLNKVDGFYARFTQKVTTADNDLIQEGKGQMWVSRPHYFDWQISEPDNTTIVSDGESVWVYMPEVQQVTIMSLKQVVDNRLLLLITDSKNAVWNDYRVSRSQDAFSLEPSDKTKQTYQITVLPTGMISNFTIIEEDGQRSYYELSHQKLGKVEQHQFTFAIPENITVDDQR